VRACGDPLPAGSRSRGRAADTTYTPAGTSRAQADRLISSSAIARPRLSSVLLRERFTCDDGAPLDDLEERTEPAAPPPPPPPPSPLPLARAIARGRGPLPRVLPAKLCSTPLFGHPLARPLLPTLAYERDSPPLLANRGRRITGNVATSFSFFFFPFFFFSFFFQGEPDTHGRTARGQVR